MNTSASSQPSAGGTLVDDVYKKALENEGLVPADDLVRMLRELHSRTLTSGLVMRAYSAHRMAKARAAQQSANQSAAKPRS